MHQRPDEEGDALRFLLHGDRPTGEMITARGGQVAALTGEGFCPCLKSVLDVPLYRTQTGRRDGWVVWETGSGRGEALRVLW